MIDARQGLRSNRLLEDGHLPHPPDVPESGGFHEEIERKTMGKYDKYVSVWSNIGAR